MRQSIRTAVFFCFAVLPPLSLTGCVDLGEGTRQPVRLYTLQPTATSAEKAPPKPLSVGIGPVDLPDYLRRPQVVTFVPPNEFRLAAFARWAEPLEENIGRTLAADMTRLLAGERVLTFPWRPAHQPEYRLRLKIQQFEAVAGDAAYLAVQWSIEPAAQERVARHGFFTAQSPLSGEETAQVVAAMSRALGDFSRRMAQELLRLAEQPTRNEGAPQSPPVPQPPEIIR